MVIKKSGVYKILNLQNGKFYIGSSVNLHKRFIQHKNDLSKNKHCNSYLQSSYNKYGEESFKFEIIATCPKEYNIKLEQWFLDNLKPAYNILPTAGSNTGYSFTEEHKLKLSNSHNTIMTDSLKNKLSLIKKNNPNVEHYKRIVELAKLKNSKKVIVYDINMNFINEFPSAREASRILNVDSSCIIKCCKNKLIQHKGYMFKYKD